MALIIFGYSATKTSFKPFNFLYIAVIMLIGLSRIYACSRFIHQIILTWVIAAVGLQVSLYYERKWSAWVLPRGSETILICLGAFTLVAYVSVFAESNESYLMKVPRQEFHRVLHDILNQDFSQDGGVGFEDEEEQEFDLDEEQNERMHPLKRITMKKDSFYFLEQNLRHRRVRAFQQKQQQQQQK